MIRTSKSTVSHVKDRELLFVYVTSSVIYLFLIKINKYNLFGCIVLRFTC
jgi:hypothetical protein